MKIATKPMGSIATNIGMNASRNLWITICLYRFSLLHNLRCSHQPPLPMKKLSTPSMSILRSCLALTLTPALHAQNLKKVEDLNAAAAKADAVLTLPDWERPPEAV